MTITDLNRLFVSTSVNNFKIIALKNSEMIEKIKLKLIFPFFIINISLISFY